MIPWREKLIAAGIHFLITLAVALCAAALIFFVWFPEPFDTMMGGSKLFALVAGCDLVLGPLISLVIYNSKKTRRHLLLDYLVVGAVQVAALVYGVYVVSNSRPVYVAFVKDRLEVIMAQQIEEADLQAATREEFRTRPKWGPKLIATAFPNDPAERNQLLFSGLSGKDIGVLPKYYVSYESQLTEIKSHAQPLHELLRKKSHAAEHVAQAEQKHKISRDNIKWLPVAHRWGFWTALIDADSGRPLEYLPLDPY